MGRAPCCAKVGLHRGPWTAKEDALLAKYIHVHGDGHWRSLPKKAGLLRCGKSCRLRWMNYLRPDIKRGNITPDEDDIIVKMHALLGNRWSLIAGRLPGRTDNEIKNYWNTHLSKKLRSEGTDPNTHKKLVEPYTEEPRGKTSKSSKKKKQKKTSTERSSTSDPNPIHKLKAHAPKPIRVTSLASFSMSGTNSFDWASTTPSTGSSTMHNEAAAWPRSQGNIANGYDCDDDGVLHFISHDDDQDHGDPWLPASDGSLEKIYGEYLQLLETDDGDQIQLDTFAESLLI